MTDEDGTIGHAELDVGDGSVVFLSTPSRDYESPKRHRETCEAARRWLDNAWVIDGLFVVVGDAEAHHARAEEGGAAILRPPADQPFGYRVYTAEDVEGHRWMFGQRLAR
jgi:uncharacterized glyoxalase superfamily protein PhnB